MFAILTWCPWYKGYYARLWLSQYRFNSGWAPEFMASVKKILLVSATAGAGHVRAAEALLGELRIKHPEIVAEHIDLVRYSHSLLRLTFSSSYNFSIRHYPLLYELTYKLSNNKLSGTLLKILAVFLRLTTSQFRNKIQAFDPDIIISTYFLSTLLIPPARAKICTVITDYQFHQAWLNDKTSVYFVANEEIKKKIEGESGARVIVSGIPAHPDFLREKNIDELKKNFGLGNELPVILILPCKSGKIRPEEIVKKLLSGKYNIIAVAGKNNPDTYQKFLRLKDGQYKFWPIAHSDKVDELMRMSDLVITKAGGITITECLRLKKPMIIVNPIPGQEEHNTKMIEKNHYGARINDLLQLEKEVEKILNHPGYFSPADLPPDPNSTIIETALKT